MLEQCSRGHGSHQFNDCHSSDVAEIGRIVFEDHLFLVFPITEQGVCDDFVECSRFGLGGAILGVFEPKNPVRDGRDDSVDGLVSRLSARELQIAVLVAQGHATKNIAYQLQISEWTVATYMRRLFAKLDVENRAAMVYRCAPLITASLGPERERHRAAQARPKSG